MAGKLALGALGGMTPLLASLLLADVEVLAGFIERALDGGEPYHLIGYVVRLIGLTGTPEQLAAAAKAYRVESKTVGTSWKGDPIIAHGSYIFLMGPDGGFATLLPPVLDAEAMAETIGRYL